jgi:hypothetical protein
VINIVVSSWVKPSIHASGLIPGQEIRLSLPNGETFFINRFGEVCISKVMKSCEEGKKA